ncbi:hypothetical protein [Fusobacterium mortiferum]|uniref:Uncharacterized protein n=1 Tax=Fusobacterium mortiferum TaxID=850 RepID=A0ABS2G0H4_FUSMR|nr:hypothetical protein [Fusobacterium mortiferum]MBM6874597.1 hypothetical protein [Fusobacterium mortiferum]
MIKKYQDELEKILNGCSICKAKLCKSCPNGRRKRYLKNEIEKVYPKQKDFFDKIKERFFSFFNKK